ncbi:hypothetical protein PTH_1648 [Pelotomaculum thermopropionicum SI]|uniref:Uncharacterized protein n=1 Tax=Pelotomaculum thermopropionicum (strain DSM 13744 / JCM 10971 / SI) TaxID=370438 RepID=A5D1R2_PELTS|nr:hypothetical protein PTH_1648 [Pelotomaculum thermopropionicum SI]
MQVGAKDILIACPFSSVQSVIAVAGKNFSKRADLTQKSLSGMIFKTDHLQPFPV